MYSNDAGHQAIITLRTSGKYKGSGFVIYLKGNDGKTQRNTLYCYERIDGPNKIETTGSYCPKLFNGKYLSYSGNAYQYTLP